MTKEELNNKLKELTEDELNQVAGGEGREKTISITVHLPNNVLEKYFLYVYVDGLLQSSMTKEIDPSLEMITLSFKGVEGFKQVCVKVNNAIYKTYQLNFDNKEYHEL